MASSQWTAYQELLPHTPADVCSALIGQLHAIYPLVPRHGQGWPTTVVPSCTCEWYRNQRAARGSPAWCTHSAVMIKLAYKVDKDPRYLATCHGFPLTPPRTGPVVAGLPAHAIAVPPPGTGVGSGGNTHPKRELSAQCLERRKRGRAEAAGSSVVDLSRDCIDLSHD